MVSIGTNNIIAFASECIYFQNVKIEEKNEGNGLGKMTKVIQGATVTLNICASHKGVFIFILLI